MEEVVEAIRGKWMKNFSYNPNEVITGVSTDSRQIRKGKLFFALRGDHHNGHDFMDQVFQRGASAAVVDQRYSLPVRLRKKIKNLIQVKDTTSALGDLAHAWRKKFDIPVIAITGSNGKTTTKDMMAAILGTRYHVLKTEGNFNNFIGLPLTLFRLNKNHDMAVVEMGMNHKGEIDRLSKIAEPNVGVITNVGSAHIKNFKNQRDIACVKGELLAHLPKKGTAILSPDNSYRSLLKKISRAQKMLMCGTSSHIVSNLGGLSFETILNRRKVSFHLPIPGKQNATNALLAIKVGEIFSISPQKMQKGFSSFHPAGKRMETLKLSDGIDVINDCYNANPDSMQAAFEFLQEVGEGRRKVALLGDMLELGQRSKREHILLGQKVAQAGAALLVAVGLHGPDMMRGASERGLQKFFLFKTAEEAASVVVSLIQSNDLILVKGSRGMKMEKITEALRKMRG